MLPTETYSGDAVPQVPWTPAVWQQGPDALIATAQQQLWQDQQDITSDVLGSDDRAFDGTKTSDQNESDIMVPAAAMSRGQAWQQQVSDMRRTEPLAAWASGMKDGPPNPNV